MVKKEDIIEAGIEYTLVHNPMCLGGDAFSDVIREMNRNKSFEAGAEWMKKQMIEATCEWLMNCESLQMRDYNIQLFRKAME